MGIYINHSWAPCHLEPTVYLASACPSHDHIIKPQPMLPFHLEPTAPVRLYRTLPCVVYPRTKPLSRLSSCAKTSTECTAAVLFGARAGNSTSAVRKAAIAAVP